MSEKSSCNVVAVRAPAPPAQPLFSGEASEGAVEAPSDISLAQRFLGGGLGRGAKPPSEFPSWWGAL